MYQNITFPFKCSEVLVTLYNETFILKIIERKPPLMLCSSFAKHRALVDNGAGSDSEPAAVVSSALLRAMSQHKVRNWRQSKCF